MQQTIRNKMAVLLAAGLLFSMLAVGQGTQFTIAWTKIGELVSTAGQGRASAPRGTKIARVEVLPAVVEVDVGKQVCLASLQVHAIGVDGKPVAGVPLSIEVREDHRQPLQITRPRGLCMRPARSGEYPIRFTSKLPAPDNTLRGAQVFLRAR